MTQTQRADQGHTFAKGDRARITSQTVLRNYPELKERILLVRDVSLDSSSVCEGIPASQVTWQTVDLYSPDGEILPYEASRISNLHLELVV